MATDTEKATESGNATTSPVLNRLVVVLALLGAGIAIYLTWAHASGADIPCGARRDCATVAASGYSRFLGVPVAAWGAALYLLLAGLALARERAPGRERTLLRLLLLGAAAGTLASLYLTYRELFTIRALCTWCLASQILMLALLGTALWDWLLRRGVSGETRLMLGLAMFVLLGAGSLFLLDAVGDLPERPAERPQTSSVPADTFAALMRDARHVRGAPDAPVTIIEFADFECASCRRAHDLIVSRLGTTIPARFAFRHLPLETIHPRAVAAAVAAEAAARQGKFWEMYDALFAGKDKDPALDDAAIEAKARQIGLDLGRFRADRKNPALEEQVRADAARAYAIGVEETPTFLIREEASGQVTMLSTGQRLQEFLRQKKLLPTGGGEDQDPV